MGEVRYQYGVNVLCGQFGSNRASPVGVLSISRSHDASFFLFGLMFYYLDERTPDGSSEILQRQFVAFHPQARNHANRDGREIAMVPKLFTGVHVGNMHLNEPCTIGNLRQRVPQGNRGVGEPTGG